MLMMRVIVPVYNFFCSQPVYDCSDMKCHRYDNQSRIQNMDILKITTSRITVREADEVNGEEMYFRILCVYVCFFYNKLDLAEF